MCRAPTAETVMEVLAEGGSVTVSRNRSKAGAWEFFVMTDEGTLLDFLSDEERATFGDGIMNDGPVATFEDALVLLDKYQWVEMHPREVHADFCAAVWAAVVERRRSSRRGHEERHDRPWDDWHRICLVGRGRP